MRRALFAICIAAVLVTAVTGCRTLFGRGRGPIETIAFLPQHNPGLTATVEGAINERPEPKEVVMVVPPGTDVRALVATITLNTEATVTVISSGEQIVQRNSQTPNDFTLPVIYSVEVPGDDEPWLYRVTVREADVNARLSALTVEGAVQFEPRFRPDLHRYVAEVPYSSRTVRLVVRAESPYLQRIAVDGTIIRGAGGSASVDFESGDVREVQLETVAEDGVSRELYHVTLQRAAPDSNPALSSLTLADATLSPVFDRNRLHYSGEVPHSARQITVAAQPESRYATVTIEPAAGFGPISISGDPVGSRGAGIAFRDTDRLQLVVVVRAEDGTSLRYTLDVRRAAPTVSQAAAPTQTPTPTPTDAPIPAPAPDATRDAAPDAEGAPLQPPQPAATRAQPVSMDLTVRSVSVQLERTVAQALGGAEIANAAEIRVRRYRTEEVLVFDEPRLGVQRRGNAPPALAFDWRAPRLSMADDAWLEIEVAVPTAAGSYLRYSRALPVADGVTVLDVPFYLLSGTPRTAWPAPGAEVPVDGRFTMVPPGQLGHRAIVGGGAIEVLPRDGSAASGAWLTVWDARDGEELYQGQVWSGRGVRAGRAQSFDRPIALPEGREVHYRFEVRGPDGRGWRSEALTLVRTSRITPDGGFEPALLFAME